MSAVKENGYSEPLRYEKLDGKPVLMAGARVNHNQATGNIYTIFRRFLHGKSCRVYGDGVEIILTDDDTVIPDITVVCNKDMIKDHAIVGTPDLIVEVLSPSTMQRDRGYKKDLYERCGVKEYWIVSVDTGCKGYVEAYVLDNGKYQMHGVYLPDFETNRAKYTKRDRDVLVSCFSPAIFPDMVFKMDEVFENIE
jgi:Uma2 family endonuclease